MSALGQRTSTSARLHLVDVDHGEIEVRTVAVGFADLCGFTKLSRSLDERALVDLLDRFEGAALLALPAAGATVVKLLGDGVLFHADDPELAVDAAALLVAETQADGHLPPVRAAVAVGTVVVRGGDCFGEVVNRASRMLDAAPPHAVVVDASVIAALAPSATSPHTTHTGPAAHMGRPTAATTAALTQPHAGRRRRPFRPLGHPHLRDYGPWPMWTAVS